MRIAAGTALTLTLFAMPGFSRNAPVEFEVASVKRVAQPRNTYATRGGPGTSDPERLTMENQTVQGMILIAYHLAAQQVVGPSWLDNDRYDVSAKVPPGVNRDQMRVMLQNLLVKRFNLAVHREAREFRVYEIGVEKSGAKLTPIASTAPPSPRAENRIADGRLRWTLNGYTMDGLAGWLSAQFGAIAINSTGLTGAYDMDFDFELPRPGDGAVDAGGPFAALIETAFETKFGLRIQGGKRKMDALVVDHADRIPTGN